MSEIQLRKLRIDILTDKNIEKVDSNKKKNGKLFEYVENRFFNPHFIKPK